MVVHGYMCRGEECCIVMMFYPFDIRRLSPSSHPPPPTPAHPPIQREPPLQDALGAEGGPKIVTEALARFEDDTEIQTVGCDAVQSLCYSHTVNTAALQVRGEEGERETGGLRGGAAAVLTNPPFTNPSHVLTMPAKRDFSLHLNVHLYSFHSNSLSVSVTSSATSSVTVGGGRDRTCVLSDGTAPRHHPAATMFAVRIGNIVVWA